MVILFEYFGLFALNFTHCARGQRSAWNFPLFDQIAIQKFLAAKLP
jgi:hypothetical protein